MFYNVNIIIHYNNIIKHLHLYEREEKLMIKCTCGADNADTTRFCYKCGKPIEPLNASIPQQPYSQMAQQQYSQQVAPNPTQPTQPKRPYAVCPRCQLAIYRNVNSCPRCNTPLYQQFATQQTQQVQYNRPNIVCPRCRQVSVPGSAFCSKCGLSFTGETKTSASLQYIGIIIGILSAVLYGISIFFPYISISLLGVTNSASLFDGGSDKYIIIGIALIAILLACFKKPISSIIIGIVAIVVSIVEMNSVYDSVMPGYENLVEYGFGYYSLIIGAIGILAGGIVAEVIKIKTT